MEYDFIDGWSIKTFIGNVNAVAENGWKPVWSTLRVEYNKEKELEYFVVITERN